MQIEEAIHMLKSYAGMTHKLTDNQGRPKLDQAIETVLNELEEQTEANKELNKVLIHFKAVINEMAKYINNKDNGDIYDLVCTIECENEKCRMSEGDNEYQELECIKEYFLKKVEKQ